MDFNTLLSIFGKFPKPAFHKTQTLEEVIEFESKRLQETLPIYQQGTLGNQLKIIEDNINLAKKKKEDEAQAILQAKRDAERAIVEKFLEAVKTSFIHDIRNGCWPEPVKIPIDILVLLNWQGWVGEKSDSKFPSHHMNYLESFEKFRIWGTNQGLDISLHRTRYMLMAHTKYR